MSKTVAEVSKGVLHVKYLSSKKSSFFVRLISLRSQVCHKDEANLATPSLADFTDLEQWSQSVCQKT